MMKKAVRSYVNAPRVKLVKKSKMQLFLSKSFQMRWKSNQVNIFVCLIEKICHNVQELLKNDPVINWNGN